MQQGNSDVYDTSGKGTYASNGVSPMFNKPVNTNAARNMQSLKPGGGIGDGSSDAMRAAMIKMGLMPKEESPVEENDDMGENEDMKEGAQLDISDFAAALFEGEELSDSFKQKCIAVFEAAVNEKVAVLEAAMLEASKTIIEEQVTASVGTITEGVDKYLTYVCEEWMKENKLAVETGMKAEIVENFIHGLKDLFENSFIDVPDEKYNVVDELFEANSDLESKLNAQINENLELRNAITAHQCAEVFVEAASGLAQTEIEKLASLAEGIEFDSVEQYKEKINVLRESYFGGSNSEPTSSQPRQQFLGENVAHKAPTHAPEMDVYVKTITEQLKLTNK